MRRRYTVGLVAALWLGLTLPAHAVVLRYDPEVGQVTKHKIEMAGRTEVTMPGMPDTVRMEMTSLMRYTQKALSKQGGVARLETKFTGGKVTVSAQGETQTMDMPTTGRVVADVDGRRRVVKVIESDLGNMGVPGQMGAAPDAWSSWSSFGAFPERDLNPDDTWTDKLTIPVTPGSAEATITYTSKLLALTTFQDRKCAKIRTSFQGPLKFDPSAFGIPASGSDESAVTATLQGDLVWYYDYEKSVDVYGEGTVGMNMSMTMDIHGGPQTMQTKMLLNLKTSLEK
jgi:hypothetical protein